MYGPNGGAMPPGPNRSGVSCIDANALSGGGFNVALPLGRGHRVCKFIEHDIECDADAPSGTCNVIDRMRET